MYYVPQLFHFTVFQRGAVLHQEEVGEGISQLVAQLQKEEELRDNWNDDLILQLMLQRSSYYACHSFCY